MSVGFNQTVNDDIEYIGEVRIKQGIGGLPISEDIATDMVDLIPNSWYDTKKYMINGVFDRDSYAKDHRVLDICCNSGVLLEKFCSKFKDRLSRVIQDSEDREDYILSNLIYSFVLDGELTVLLRNKFYWGKKCKGNIFNYNILDNSGTDSHRLLCSDGKILIKDSELGDWEDMVFNIICGNPPYGNDAYLDFVKFGHMHSIEYDLWITPSKFIAKRDKYGKNDDFRDCILDSIKELVLYIHTHEVFSILSDGGIAYYLCDKDKHSGIDVKNICNEVPALVNVSCELIKDKDVKKYSLVNISDTILDKLYLSDFMQYHPKEVIESDYNFYLTSQFGGSGAPTNRFFATDGKALVLSGYEILQRGIKPKSGTTMRLFSSSSVTECNNYLSWIYSKFVRFLLVCGMCVRSSVSDECWRFVPDPGSFDKMYEDRPLEGYTTDDNGEYIDRDGNKHCSLYLKYKLTDDEINIIESVIRDRK